MSSWSKSENPISVYGYGLSQTQYKTFEVLSLVVWCIGKHGKLSGKSGPRLSPAIYCAANDIAMQAGLGCSSELGMCTALPYMQAQHILLYILETVRNLFVV